MVLGHEFHVESTIVVSCIDLSSLSVLQLMIRVVMTTLRQIFINNFIESASPNLYFLVSSAGLKS